MAGRYRRRCAAAADLPARPRQLPGAAPCVTLAKVVPRTMGLCCTQVEEPYMGQLRFYAPQLEQMLPHAVDLAYVAGLEAVPWRSCNTYRDQLLCLDRSISESGNLYFPWLVPDIGWRMLSTCTLMERDEPYCLTTELARGTVHRARSLVAQLQTLELDVPAEPAQLLDEAVQELFSSTIAAAQDRAGAEQPARARSPSRRAPSICSCPTIAALRSTSRRRKPRRCPRFWSERWTPRPCQKVRARSGCLPTHFTPPACRFAGATASSAPSRSSRTRCSAS